MSSAPHPYFKPLGWSLLHSIHNSPFEGCPGTKRLTAVHKIFERFSKGKPGERVMNQAGFQGFCEEVGTVNDELTRRLFLAIDDDNTGSIDCAEFLAGLRLLCDESGGEPWKKKRIQFCFNLIDGERNEIVDAAQIKGFLKALYTESRALVVGMMGQLEDVLGMNIGVVAGGATTHKVRWSEEPSLQAAFRTVEERRLKQYSRMRTFFSDFRERAGASFGGSGVRLAGFQRWCTTTDESVRLRVLEWLTRLGHEWLHRISLSVEGRDQHPDPGHHGHFDHGPGHITRTAYQVVRIPMLRAQFHRLTEENLVGAFGESFVMLPPVPGSELCRIWGFHADCALPSLTETQLHFLFTFRRAARCFRKRQPRQQWLRQLCRR